jgi:hypothetical protein
VRGEDVSDAARLAVSFLQRYVGQEWSVPVPGLDFTVASVVAHAGESFGRLLWVPATTATVNIGQRLHNIPGLDY